MIPISQVALADGTEDLVLEVLRSGQIAQGPVVERFEHGFAKLTGVAHAVAVNSGTTALIAALRVLDLGPGDEVITSPFTFAATLNAVLDAGASVRFADIGVDDFSMDPDAVAAAVTDRTRCCCPCTSTGSAADLDRLEPIAARHELAMVEDAAQAHGATIGDRRAGSVRGSAASPSMPPRTSPPARGEWSPPTTTSSPSACGSCATRACGAATSTSWPATTTG